MKNDFYDKFVRKGIITSEMQEKALTVGDATAGGVLVPATLAASIIQKLELVDPIASLASVETISTDSLEIIKEKGTFGTGWTTEQGTRSATANQTFGIEKIPVHAMYAMPVASQKLLNDSRVNIEQWLLNKIVMYLRKTEGAAFVVGDGVGKPEGLLPGGTMKDGGTSFKTGDNAGLKPSAPFDCFIDALYDLHPDYAANAVWIMAPATAAALRKTKDSTYKYMLDLGRGPGQDTLLGRPIYYSPNMPSLTTQNNYPVVLADLKSAYQIVRNPSIAMVRDNITVKGFVNFYTESYVGGQIVNIDAIRYIQTSA